MTGIFTPAYSVSKRTGSDGTLVFFTDLARRLDVSTPTMDAIIELTSVVLGHDLRAEAARTMRSLALDRLSNNELLSL